MSATGVTGDETCAPMNDKIDATFTEALDPATVTTATFTLKQGATPVSGTVSYTGTTATFAPSVTLLPTTTYTATVTTSVKDLATNALSHNYVWSFTTVPPPNTTPPRPSSPYPHNAAPDVPINAKFDAHFTEALDPATVNTLSFTLKQGLPADLGIAVSGTVSYTGTTATFTPFLTLLPNTTYAGTV